MAVPESDYVTLRGGCVVSAAVLRRVWAIEARGVRFAREGDDIILAPDSLVTDDDLAFLRVHKPALMALVCYIASDLWRPSWQPHEVTA